MNKEDINNLKEMLVDFNEYSTDYTKTRCKELEKTVENTLNEIDRLINIIKDLSKDVDMWNKKYNEQFNIIDELEKWVKEDVKEEKPDLYFQVLRKIDILDKLKELKENNK